MARLISKTGDFAVDSNRGWLERISLIGLSSIEAPLLAALVTGSPLFINWGTWNRKELALDSGGICTWVRVQTLQCQPA